MAATVANSLTLVSSGLADTRLQPSKGNPNISQFVKVVRKTTRWAAVWNRIDFDGSPEFGQRVSCTLPVKGELITGLNIVATMPDIYTVQQRAKQAAGSDGFLGPNYGWTNSLGHALIQQIELEIGGVIVETLNSQQLEILDELYETVESSIAKNAMIKRVPNGFTPLTWQQQTTVYVPIPFWFSRPGIYSKALPIEALNVDRVRIHVTFRPVSQLFYTDARVDTRTVGYRPGVDPIGGMWGLEGARFWRADATKEGDIYTMNSHMVKFNTNTNAMIPVKGEIIQGITMPTRLSLGDAYALVEYISLEEYEAMTLRSAELTYNINQHLALSVEQTLQTKEQRLALPYTNPTKELFWVFQNPAAETFNAWFLFTRDLAGVPPARAPPNPCLSPWWPDATVLPTAQANWRIKPAFQQSYSEPLESAILLYSSYERFQHEASYLRSVVPSIYYAKSALYNRYVYAYSFGQKMSTHEYEPKGAANWDKIGRKELYLTLKNSSTNLNLYVYVTIWNVFKVYGGRGSMLFSN
jgi:hypothetical protein